eukprot:1434990-Pyramimonas_sp.AAC.1
MHILINTTLNMNEALPVLMRSFSASERSGTPKGRSLLRTGLLKARVQDVQGVPSQSAPTQPEESQPLMTF